jgi:hypothetical protein
VRSRSVAELFLGIFPAWAHIVSMSTGELSVDGPTAVYELRMPMFEVAHIAKPETALLDHIRFGDAHRTSGACHEEDGSYDCRATYEFSGLVDRLDVECTFFQITVPNHIHILTAVQGSNGDQAVFDQSFPRAEVRFRPPSRIETVRREAGAGLWRAIASPAGLMILFGLAMASRTGHEAVILAAMFLAGEGMMRLIAPRIPWPLAPRFIEAAMALSVAYLAVEILVLPEAGRRWIIVLALGFLHGLYFAGFPATYLAGAVAAQAVVIAVLVLAMVRLPAVWRARPAWALLSAGLAWFAWRLIG